MSDLSNNGETVAGGAHQPWYRRRASQIAIAGTVAAGLAVAGLSLGSTASAEVAPQDAVAEAVANLQELPSGVTINGTEEMPGSLTLVRTDAGVQLTVSAPEKDAAVGMALVDERLFLRVAGGELDKFSGNPLALGATVAFPSLGALLQGQWVSLDVSEDSKVLAAVQELGVGQVEDPAALEAAAQDLRTALEAVAEEARGALQGAMENNVTVAEPAQPVAGPAGSTHYQVVIDKQAIADELEPTMREALEQVLTAVDAFVADAGAQLPDGGAMWGQARAELLAKIDAALAEKTAVENGTLDVWVADGEFTQVVVEGATLTFNPDAELDAPVTAVSMDDDLVALLPLLQEYAGGALPIG